MKTNLYFFIGVVIFLSSCQKKSTKERLQTTNTSYETSQTVDAQGFLSPESEEEKQALSIIDSLVKENSRNATKKVFLSLEAKNEYTNCIKKEGERAYIECLKPLFKDFIFVHKFNSEKVFLSSDDIESKKAESSFNTNFTMVSITSFFGYKAVADYLLTFFSEAPISSFEFASIAGSLDMIKFLAQRGDRFLERALGESVKYGHIDIVKYLISEKEVNQQYTLNRSLELAAQHKHIGVMEYLIENGATDLNGLLSDLAGKGQLEEIKVLIENGADDIDGSLHTAVVHNHIDVAKYMISKGAKNLNRPLPWAIDNNNLEMAQLLVSNGADNFNDGLESSVGNNNLKLVKFFISKGADNIDECAKIAVESRKIEVLKELLKSQPTNLNELLKSLTFYNLPHEFEMAQLLITNGANNFNEALLALGDFENYPSYYAFNLSQDLTDKEFKEVKKINYATLDLLIESGANNINEALLKLIEDPLFVFQIKYIELVNYFIEKGANNFNEALIQAIYLGNSKLVNYFIEQGASNFNQALLVSAKLNRVKMAQLFIEKGANNFNEALAESANFKNKKYTYDNNTEFIKLLVDQGADQLNQALLISVQKENVNAVETLISLGANNFKESAEHALLIYSSKVLDYFFRVSPSADINNYLLEVIRYHSVLFFIEDVAKEAVLKLLYYLENSVTYNPEEQPELDTSKEEDILLKLNENISKEEFEGIQESPFVKIEIMKKLIKQGANNLNEALIFASSKGHPEIVEFLIESGATQLDEALEKAFLFKQDEVIKILQKKGASCTKQEICGIGV